MSDNTEEKFLTEINKDDKSISTSNIPVSNITPNPAFMDPFEVSPNTHFYRQPEKRPPISFIRKRQT